MTLVAGVFDRHGRPIAESTCAALRRLITRNPGDAISVFSDGRSFFVKVDLGALGEPAARVDPNGALTLLTGEPLLSLDDGESRHSRAEDLALLHERALRGDWSLLRQAAGTFAAVHYNPVTGSLSLVADKLGVRPLYYWMDENIFVFASALRVFEELAEVPQKMDVRAVTEIVGLGVPLGNRTPYANIFSLTAAEIVEVKEAGISHRQYWRWDEIETSGDAEPERLREVYDRFQAGVARRTRNDRSTVAYLSGGLDSRCVVSALAQRGTSVHTFNFARPGTQDYVFGNEFAQEAATIHETVPKDAGDSTPDYSTMMAKAWSASGNRHEFPPERPHLVWSGEGGSVLLGHVHISEEIVKLMRAGKIDDAIEEYLRREQAYVPAKLFKPQIVEVLRDTIKQGIREELNDLRTDDPGRAFYLFLMQNDQRRKLARHFENIDLHRLEFQLPFFDSAFLSSVIATPIDLCLRHRLYVKWLSHFPAAVTAVPWQSYPTHEPCPIAVPAKLSRQWDETYQAEERAAQKRALLTRASELLSAPDFPREILNKRNLRFAAWMHSLGLRDLEYAIEAAQTYYAYWRKCGGEFALPA